ncbi:MAG TPA: MerR family transcriptional regulator [Micromonosporaceae bacterium]|nr:MerR family transcriptional regulator [Micromonosporaceae bacterium]
MSWSIQQVARLSGVTARTLRYYDEIGLLHPDRTGPNGYRYYEREQLLRLQQILLLRELDMDLVSIAAVVDGVRDRVEALRTHHERLLAERGRLDRLARTVATTIAHLEEGTVMPPEEMFEGFRFNRETIAELEALAVERTGQEEQPHFEELKRRTADWTDEQFRQVEQEGADIERRLLALLRQGVAVDDPAVFTVLDDDIEAQRKLLPLDGDGYAALGRAFKAAPELRAHLDAQDPRLADFMGDAMVAYASARMG